MKSRSVLKCSFDPAKCFAFVSGGHKTMGVVFSQAIVIALAHSERQLRTSDRGLPTEARASGHLAGYIRQLVHLSIRAFREI